MTAFLQNVSVLRKPGVMSVARTGLCSTSAMIPFVPLVVLIAQTGPLVTYKNVARVVESTELA